MWCANIDIGCQTPGVAVVDEAGQVLLKPQPVNEDAEGSQARVESLGRPQDVLVALEATVHSQAAGRHRLHRQAPQAFHSAATGNPFPGRDIPKGERGIMKDERGTLKGERGTMKKTRLSAVASLLAAGVLMGGCMADFGGESEGGAAQELNVGGGEAVLKSPASSSRGNGTFDVFALGTENNIYIRGMPPVASGHHHNLAVKSDGTLWAWGTNDYGQLGDGTTGVDRSPPVRVSGLTGVVGVAVSGSSSLAVKSDGTLWAWGFNGNGQLGDGTTTDRLTPKQVPNLTGVVAVAAGDSYVLAVKSDGTLWTWGKNDYGQLGDGTKTDRLTPKQVLTGVVAVAAGHKHSLAVKSDGTLWAWGWNLEGQLGDGTKSTGSSAPKQVPNLTGVVAVAAGDKHSLAVKSDGTLWAWGENYWAQLGDGTTTPRLEPNQVPNMKGFVAVAASNHNSLALKSDGTLWGWGRNTDGQLGDTTTYPYFRRTPVPVNLPGGVVAMDAGGGYILAVKSDGTLWTWGNNERGQLGDGTRTARSTPGQLPGLFVKL